MERMKSIAAMIVAVALIAPAFSRRMKNTMRSAPISGMYVINERIGKLGLS